MPTGLPQVLCITAAVAVASWLAVGGTLLALAPRVPFLARLPPHELWVVASLGGTLAMARSPASAVNLFRTVSMCVCRCVPPAERVPQLPTKA